MCPTPALSSFPKEGRPSTLEIPVLRTALADPQEEALHAYCAGFFDGEGYVGIGGSGSRTHLSMTVAQITPAPLTLMRDTYGGSIATKVSQTGHRTQYRWSLTGQRAAEALSLMLPYLMVKSNQARIAIAFQNTKNTARPRWTTKWHLKQYEEAKQMITELKKVSFDSEGFLVDAKEKAPLWDARTGGQPQD